MSVKNQENPWKKVDKKESLSMEKPQDEKVKAEGKNTENPESEQTAESEKTPESEQAAESAKNPESEQDTETEGKTEAMEATVKGEGGETVLPGAQEELNQLMEYLKPKLPPEITQLLDQGKSPTEAFSVWENLRLKKENEALRLKLEKANQPIGELAGEGFGTVKDPFVEGFMQALSER